MNPRDRCGGRSQAVAGEQRGEERLARVAPRVDAAEQHEHAGPPWARRPNVLSQRREVGGHRRSTARAEGLVLVALLLQQLGDDRDRRSTSSPCAASGRRALTQAAQDAAVDRGGRAEFSRTSRMASSSSTASPRPSAARRLARSDEAQGRGRRRSARSPRAPSAADAGPSRSRACSVYDREHRGPVAPDHSVVVGEELAPPDRTRARHELEVADGDPEVRSPARPPAGRPGHARRAVGHEQRGQRPVDRVLRRRPSK